jgi:hypothetical protein
MSAEIEAEDAGVGTPRERMLRVVKPPINYLVQQSTPRQRECAAYESDGTNSVISVPSDDSCSLDPRYGSATAQSGNDKDRLEGVYGAGVGS